MNDRPTAREYDESAHKLLLPQRERTFELSDAVRGRLPAHPPVPRHLALVPMETACPASE